MALVTAIDAKDEYSHGHSVRVAEYAVRIAREMGKSEEECEQIYYAGLLHDVGKIGIDDSIKAIQAATTFFIASSRAGNYRISNA